MESGAELDRREGCAKIKGRLSGRLGNYAMNKIFERLAESIASTLMAFSKGRPLDQLLVVEHQLPGVTPEMITWWWSNMQDTARYQLWHPDDHISFRWEIPPMPGHVGTIQVARERIGGIPTTLRIRFDDPGGLNTPYACILAGSILDHNDRVVSRLTHEYEAMPGGTKMRSIFYLPKTLYRVLHKGLRQHNIEEMANFSQFLPGLYQASSRN